MIVKYEICLVFFKNGNIGVNIFCFKRVPNNFFTYKRKRIKKDISLRYFYLCRIFRIWPLYYLIVIICFIFYRLIKYGSINLITDSLSIYYYLGFVSNFDVIKTFPQMPNVLPFIVLWCISVMEQFYLI